MHFNKKNKEDKKEQKTVTHQHTIHSLVQEEGREGGMEEAIGWKDGGLVGRMSEWHKVFGRSFQVVGAVNEKRSLANGFGGDTYVVQSESIERN